MELVQAYLGKRARAQSRGLRRTISKYFFDYINKHAEVFESYNRQLTPYGGNCLPVHPEADADRLNRTTMEPVVPRQQHLAPQSNRDRNRYSVIYQRHEQYHHVGCTSYAEAQTILDRLATDEQRKAVGIYDARTELFEWEPTRQQEYNQASMGDKGRQAEQIITIAQALRRRDTSWQSGDFVRPSVFA